MEHERDAIMATEAAPQYKYASFRKMMHTREVRTTINLDPDAHSFASAYAHGKGITLSAALSELVRRAEQAPEQTSGRLKRNEHGYLVIARTGHVLTPEMVKEASEDELI